jgi:PrtD family type I secretion system ABC transporter
MSTGQNRGFSGHRQDHGGILQPDELTAALRTSRPYFVNAALFSLAINLLYLASPIYMLQVYDRVVSSASIVTLVMLTVVLLIAFLALAGLDVVRARLLTRASMRLDRLLSGRVLTALMESESGTGRARSQPLRDFDSLRQFITGRGVHALFDLPWTPIYLVIIFILHPVLGAFALSCTVTLVALAFLNERLTNAPLREANAAADKSYSFTEMSLRNSEAVKAMGMAGGVLKRWADDRTRMIDRQISASDHSAVMSSLIRFLRLSMQSVILGLGAYLVIERSLTAGAIFAGSILLSRSLQPVEQVVASWRGFVSARDSFLRVRKLLNANPQLPPRLELPRPRGKVSVEGLCYAVPGTAKAILRNVSFHVGAGEALGVIGPSGAGKSTLIRHIVGLIRPTVGVVRLDGADIAAWPRTSAGRYIGYLPQDVELFADTIAANIGRFSPATSEAVVAAAQMAGVHEMILRLPDGYETEVGEGGMTLSGGYRQRIGLARAVLDNPALVVLDEPSSNLDAAGDTALNECILRLKKNGTTVVLVSHRPATIAAVDTVVMLMDGMVAGFGPRAEIMAKVTPPPPLTVITNARGA